MSIRRRNLFIASNFLWDDWDEWLAGQEKRRTGSDADHQLIIRIRTGRDCGSWNEESCRNKRSTVSIWWSSESDGILRHHCEEEKVPHLSFLWSDLRLLDDDMIQQLRDCPTTTNKTFLIMGPELLVHSYELSRQPSYIHSATRVGRVKQ